MTQPPSIPQVVSRTMFWQGDDEQWNWNTKSLTNEVIAQGSEPYESLKKALDAFFLSQGITYDFGMWPQQYGPLLRLPENQFQINKYTS